MVNERNKLVRRATTQATVDRSSSWLVEQEAAHVESPRELDVLRHLAAHKPEALQLDTKDVWGSFQRKLLRGGHLGLALFTFVRVVAFESLSTEVVAQSVFHGRSVLNVKRNILPSKKTSVSEWCKE